MFHISAGIVRRTSARSVPLKSLYVVEKFDHRSNWPWGVWTLWFEYGSVCKNLDIAERQDGIGILGWFCGY